MTKAVIMQESSEKGKDTMQSSEGNFNINVWYMRTRP
ncbi:MAG: hypothetical protein HFG36_09615 [Eubacterium sp.]|nr:hypothetical protein [Eubacterium sp.]